MKDMGDTSYVIDIKIQRDNVRRILGRYQSNPDMKHWKAVKKLMRKSTSGYIFMLAGGAIS
ncbi:hypothetical protein A2U01_0025821 [Trifolium medium]|uniref:Retrovirus-related Pol polyprotein from transposon TNT 1-94 n=1 Tax=Trifolium medium TaxID=97028 RepID=A0A392NZ89_9FABA|nr:hypothetical protein [Trifolium medium]